MNRTVITVSGSSRNSGKTTLICRILEHLDKKVGVLKITRKAENYKCSHSRECGICNSIENNFKIIKDEKIINMTGKDSARYNCSGSKETIWLQTSDNCFPTALKEAFNSFSDNFPLLVESTGILNYYSPSLSIFVARPDNGEPPKSYAENPMQTAHIVIKNSPYDFPLPFGITRKDAILFDLFSNKGIPIKLAEKINSVL